MTKKSTKNDMIGHEKTGEDEGTLDEDRTDYNGTKEGKKIGPNCKVGSKADEAPRTGRTVTLTLDKLHSRSAMDPTARREEKKQGKPWPCSILGYDSTFLSFCPLFFRLTVAHTHMLMNSTTTWRTCENCTFCSTPVSNNTKEKKDKS